MTDDRKKRPGTFQSDEDRAIAELERRKRVVTPAHGVVIAELDHDDFTPVGVAIERMEKAIDLSDRERMLLRLSWEHSANQEMRTRKRVELTEGGQLRSDLDDVTRRLDDHLAEVREAIVDIHGKSGTNGKLGELRRVVAEMRTRTWWFITFLAGLAATAAVKLVLVTRAFDAVEARANANEAQIKILQAQVMTLQAAAISRSGRRSDHPPGPTLEPRAEAGSDTP